MAQALFLANFLIKDQYLCHMIETSFDPSLTDMTGLPFYMPTLTYLLTEIIVGYV